MTFPINMERLVWHFSHIMLDLNTMICNGYQLERPRLERQTTPCRRCDAHFAESGNGYTENHLYHAMELFGPR